MKKSLLILLFALVSYWGWGQILTFEFSALAGGEASATSNLNDPNLTSSTITRGAGLTAAANAQRFNATAWALTSIANAVSGNDYMEFAITPNSGYQFSVSSIVVQWQRSGTGNTAIALRSSVDSYATDLDAVMNVVDNTNTQTFTWTFAQANSSTAVIYRFYSYAEAVGGTGGPGDGAGNDIVVNGITSSVGGNIPPAISNITQLPSSDITSASTVSVSSDVTDSDGTVIGVELYWGTATGVLSNTINMSNGGSGDTYTTDNDIPAQAHGTTVYYAVYAEDNAAGTTTSPEKSYKVIDPQFTTVPYSETFAADLGDCYTYSVSGDTRFWNYNVGGWAQMNGFGSSITEEDWLILPGIDFNNYSNEFMTFDTWYNFGTDDANNYLKLVYSTDYTGIGNPSAATWTELTFTKPTASLTWTSSGSIDLSGISGTSVFIGFKYRYEVGLYRYWEIDNISIAEGTPELIAGFSANQTSVNVGGTVNFTNTTVGGTAPYSYEWDLDGDGQYDDSTDPNPSYVYNTAGTYDVSLRVTDDELIVDIETKFDYITVSFVATNIIINEVDSDTPSTDVLEFVELYDGGVGNTDLSGLVVVFYNGSDDKSYAAYDLDGYSTDANGYFVLGNSAVTNVDYIFNDGSIQNGQDAVALFVGSAISFPNGTIVTTSNLLDALVYDTNDPDDAGLLVLLNSGQPQIDESGRGAGDIHSNQRIPNGSGGQRNTSTYDQALPTPGAVNVQITTSWTGATSSAWSLNGNWNYGIPASTSDVNIPSAGVTNFPIIGTSITCVNMGIALGANLQIDPAGSLTVAGTLTNNAGNSGIVINSDATGTGSLIENNGVSATVERYLTDDEWHYISSPVDNPTANVFLGIYMMEWDEPTGTWTYITSPATPLNTDMEGFSVWTYNPATVLFSGNLNTGAKSINMTNTPGAPIANDGYNFAGNPYPSSVDWNVDDGSGWSRTVGNIEPTVYIWNQTAGNYGSYVKDGLFGTNDVDNIIPPHQGFFVHVDNSFTTGTLGIDNGARIHATKDILKSGEIFSDMLKLKVTGNNFADEIIVQIDPSASVMTDQLDATKFRGSALAPQFYSLSKDNKELSINSFPVQDDYMVIPVGLEVGNETVYTISVADFAGFDFSTGLYLEDLKEGTFINLNESSTYSFTANPLDEPMRFLLHLNGEMAVPENNSEINGMKVYSFNKDVYVTSKEAMNGTAIIYDLLGREIITKKFNGESMVKINLDNQKGYMIVNIITEKGMMNQKVYIR